MNILLFSCFSTLTKGSLLKKLISWIMLDQFGAMKTVNCAAQWAPEPDLGTYTYLLFNGITSETLFWHLSGF